MATVLVVDDMKILREALTDSLQLAGYRTLCASEGREALSTLRAERVDVVLLDLTMPGMDGLSFLRAVRNEAGIAKTPVIVMTGTSDKNRVIEAASLGVRDYLLKAAFGRSELLARVAKYAPPQAVMAGDAKATAENGPATHATCSAQSASQTPQAISTDLPRLLTADACAARIRSALEAKTLSGVVAQVVAMAASPRSDLSQLASLIGKDPMLSTRVLQVANSAAYASKRPAVYNIPDAVRNIGSSAVRNAALALGIFEVVPKANPGGFHPIRSWQHSFAVAMLCEQLVGTDQPDAGAAYLVGLCHDLGEILFHTHFGPEYQQVLETQARTGRNRSEVERAMLGMTQGQLAMSMLQSLGLPEAIRRPIEAFHDGGRGEKGETAKLARVLRLADLYANGLLLASSGLSPVAPLPRVDCRTAVGREQPARPESISFRTNILAMTAMLARLSSEEEAECARPLFPSREIRIWLARDPWFSSFDPVTAAIESMANVVVHERLPVNAEELAAYSGVVLCSRGANSPGFSPIDISKVSRGVTGIPVLPLCGHTEAGPPGSPDPAAIVGPLRLERLAQFVKSLPSLEPSRETAAS